jgi:hypothetical protein
MKRQVQAAQPHTLGPGILTVWVTRQLIIDSRLKYEFFRQFHATLSQVIRNIRMKSLSLSSDGSPEAISQL